MLRKMGFAEKLKRVIVNLILITTISAAFTFNVGAEEIAQNQYIDEAIYPMHYSTDIDNYSAKELRFNFNFTDYYSNILVKKDKLLENDDYCLDVPILLYHHVQPLGEAYRLGHAQLTVDSSIFEQQMEYLTSNGYQPINSLDLIDALRYGLSVPEKSIVITLDDGYDDNFDYALPIMKKHKIKGNFMISAGLIDKAGYMRWEEVKELSNNVNMFIYNHSLSHSYLRGAVKEKIVFEIEETEKLFQKNLSKNTNIFTYPYGAFDDLVIEVLKDKGFTGAFTTQHGTIQCRSEIYKLKRFHVGNAPLSYYGF